MLKREEEVAGGSVGNNLERLVEEYLVGHPDSRGVPWEDLIELLEQARQIEDRKVVVYLAGMGDKAINMLRVGDA